MRERERERWKKGERQFLEHVSGVSIPIPGWGASSGVQFQIQTSATHTHLVWVYIVPSWFKKK